MTSTELVIRLQAKHGGVTPYRVAKNMGLTNGRVLNWLHAVNAPTPDECLRIADELEMDRAYVLTCMEAQRTSNPEVAEVWANIADGMAAA